MKTKGFFARVSVVLAIILVQSVAQDLSVNQAQDLIDSSANLGQDSNKNPRKSNKNVKNTPPQTPPARGGVSYDSPALAEGDKGGGLDLRESNANSSNSYFAPPQERFLAQADLANHTDLAKRILGSANQNHIFLAQVDSNAESQSDSNSDSTHPLAPSAREGGQVVLISAREGESNAESTQDSSTDSRDSSESTQDSYESNTDSHDNYEVVDIGTSTIRARAEYETYQSGSSVGKNLLDSNPSGNGDITSILKILPNVQFDNAQSKSTTPGEIDPANISISGGLFYQNNFQLDGFNMNNDLDPNGGTSNGPDAIRGGRSQGLNVDTSLLESITVLDSNVSASYGGFNGGVVEANVRKPRTDGWHADFSYQHTADYFTQYFIDESQESNFYTSSDENYQPKFHKHLVRANTEGYITKDLGLIASFSTTQSFIPLQAYSWTQGADINTTRTQKRQSYNAFIKANYNPTETLTLEASLAYMPQFNSYYNAIAKDSYYEMRSGGWQTGLKALWQAPVGLWTNTLGYSYLQNSRRSEANYFMSWYASNEKNWAVNSANRASEGDMAIWTNFNIA